MFRVALWIFLGFLVGVLLIAPLIGAAVTFAFGGLPGGWEWLVLMAIGAAIGMFFAWGIAHGKHKSTA